MITNPNDQHQTRTQPARFSYSPPVVDPVTTRHTSASERGKKDTAHQGITICGGAVRGAGRLAGAGSRLRLVVAVSGQLLDRNAVSLGSSAAGGSAGRGEGWLSC